MQVFDPRQILVPSGHFIVGERVQDAARLTVLRPSDGQAHAELPIADSDADMAAGVRTADSGRWWTSARRTEVHGARISGIPHCMPRHPLQTAAFMRRAPDFPTSLAALHAAIYP